MARVVVLDAGVLIALHDNGDTHHEWAHEVFNDTLSDELVMSTLTYSEVLVHPTRANSVDRFVKDLDLLGLTITPLSTEDATALAVIRAESAVKMPDAVVLLEAGRVDAAVATTDRTLARKARERGHFVYSPEKQEKK